ncbi:hypothetical protein [Labrenzia sp. PHM005]|jgi:hypothetical protein|nr:hypothetical protein [Labrenzia sp. PHM005]
MNRRASSTHLPESRLPCLTEMGLTALVAGALGLAGLLWIAIVAVL